MTVAAVKHLVDNATKFKPIHPEDGEEVPPLFDVVPIADLAHSPPAPPLFAWEGLVPLEHVSLFGAHGGAGKTILMLMLAVSTVLGRPLFKPVIIHLTSKDVIHSFKVLPLRICQDAIPGMSIPIHFMPTRVGKYAITCAQLCGNGHATMIGWLTVMDNQPQRSADGAVTAPGAFDQWLASHVVGGSKPSLE